MKRQKNPSGTIPLLVRGRLLRTSGARNERVERCRAEGGDVPAKEEKRGSLPLLKSSDRYEYALKCGFYFNRLPG